MKKLILIALSLTLSQPCHAALSAFSQGIKEVKEILDSPYLKDNLPQSSPIQDIKLVEENGEYRIYSVSSNDKTVFAKLTYVKKANLGPRCYEIEWETASN